MKRLFQILLICMLCVGCTTKPHIVPIETLSPTRTARAEPTPEPTAIPLPVARVAEDGTTVSTRFNPSYGFTRQSAEPGSYVSYLQNLPLMAIGTEVSMQDGTFRTTKDYDAVLDMAPVSKNELEAGAIAHIRAQYFFASQEFDKISFKLNDGFTFTFDKWRSGNKLKFVDKKAAWTTGGTTSDDADNFSAYLQTYFVYSGLDSLRKDMEEVDLVEKIKIGDIFVTTGTATRVFLVVDSALDELGNQQVILLSGDRPAQQMRILTNPLDSALSPWFSVDTTNGRITIGMDGTGLVVDPLQTSMRYRFAT